MDRSQVNVARPSGASRYQAPTMRMGRSQFDLTHSHKTTFDAGYLIPYMLQEVVPGDTFTCRLNAFLRIFSPLDAPIMDDISVDVDFFFVPNRLVWSNWEYFLGAHDAAGAQDTDFTIPVCSNSNAVEVASLAHYMGIPLGLQFSVNTDVSCLPFRAYHLIYNEWYRDQNLIDSLTISKGNGPDSAAYGDNGTTHLKKSAKKHDYFTSALPYLQKGDPVEITLGGAAPVQYAGDGTQLAVYDGSANYKKLEVDTSDAGSASDPVFAGTASTVARYLYANLEGIAAVSVNALREAEAVQRLLERDARGGTRHPEIIRAHFGVDVPDYRTQRPEYLGGGRGFINVSPVANTSATASEDQGQLAGVGVGTLRASWAKSFVEHGLILGILRARGQLSYQQGLDRMWFRSTKLDFLWPELVNLGEQPIYNKELFISASSVDHDPFGYQERYAEYRFKKSLITGKFDSNAAGALDFWHLAEDFASLPGLNQTFIEDATPMARVTTVDTEPDFIIDGRFDLRVARALPVRPTPSLAPPRF